MREYGLVALLYFLLVYRVCPVRRGLFILPLRDNGYCDSFWPLSVLLTTER